MSQPPELCAIAQRVVWFESAEETLRQPKRFLAYLMTYGTVEEILTVRKYFSAQDFEAVLADPPPAIFDQCSWSYWNGVFHRRPRLLFPSALSRPDRRMSFDRINLMFSRGSRLHLPVQSTLSDTSGCTRGCSPLGNR